MPTRWLDPIPIDVPDDLRAGVGGHPLIAETLAQRGIVTSEAARAFLDLTVYRPANPFDLPGMAHAIERVRWAIRQREPICVWGDFDVDGQTSTTLLYSALRDLGAQVDYHIPNRRGEGHGVNLPVLERLIDAGAKLIVTCDTGVVAHEAVDYANSREIDVVITDHHHLPPSLPRAYAVVNPQRLAADHPLHELPGVGVAYKLIEALSGDLAPLLDLVALGIVADVATQTGDTRYLLQRGLQALRSTERLGLQALIELAELDPAYLTEEHVAFTLAPRLNALGRLDDASFAVELLTTHDLERARILAQRLEGLNAQRKLLVEQVYGAAQAQIEQNTSLLESNVLILGHPQWHAGVLGIVATRLVEQYHRPVILLVTSPGENAHGSARSVAGVDITAALTANANLLTSFGGHALAAGLSLPADHISALRRGLSRVITLPTTETTLQIDHYLELSDITPEFVADLERLAPFGAGNPPPIFAARDLTIRSHSAVGRGDEHHRVTVQDQQGNKQQVIWWRSGSLPAGRFDLAFTVRAVNDQGEPKPQIEWIDARPAQGAIWVSAPTLQIVDYRAASDPQAKLRSLTNVLVWREADSSVEGSTRSDLAPSQALAIWTIPPSSAELHEAIQRVDPAVIYLFAADSSLDTLPAFANRLAGLVKYALANRGGQFTLAALAAATTQREITVRTGLEWLVARGQITFVSASTLAQGSGQPSPDLARITDRLNALLRETAAYRAFYRRADSARLLANDL
ncbi:MAG TPA: single-stranded-DNA-specific exonuclease RecJ [Phototrophicaceae bacterium]|nr:single-stranded-DNA-specific exonuclease RecJ [Phototrophicaceae bacterium]